MRALKLILVVALFVPAIPAPVAEPAEPGKEAAAPGEAPKPATSAPEFATGTLIPKVITRHDAAQSYALYLPKAYTPDRKWPVLYGFSPNAAGTDPVKLFQDAAERYGWILVGSNNSRNGPFEPIKAAMEAMLKDTQVRLAIDEQRRYATGFSGGARVAFYLAVEKGFAGVIPAGAGMSQGQKAPEKGSKLVVCGIFGNRDFNYAEMLRLEQALKTLELRARLAVFDGDHRWPAAEFCSAALRYMELVSLLDGGKAGEKATAEILALEKADAEKLLGQKGQFLRGYGRLEELARLLKGAEAQKTFTDKIAAVEAEPRYKQEKEAQAEFNRLSAECAKIADAYERFTKTVESIQKFAADRAGTDTAELAVAQLRSLGLQMVMAGAQLFQAGRFAESGELLKRARLLAPKDAVLAYSLACAQARAGQKDDALKTIAEAVELGFKDGKRLSEDANLESLRGIDEFRKLVEKLGGPPPKEKKENFL